MESDPQQYNTIGWNGILLEVPKSYAPATILRNYLFFEDDYAPIFEIKWQKIKGKYSSTKILKRLSGNGEEKQIDQWEIPQQLKDFLTSYTVEGFCWNNENKASKGIILYTSSSQTAIILQFHNYLKTNINQYKHILSSLKIQEKEEVFSEQRIWKIFDIQATIPSFAKLEKQEFFPGKFSILFTLGKNRVSLLRFKPALALLNGRPLTTFGSLLAGKAELIPSDDATVAKWFYKARGKEKMLSIFRRKPCYTELILTHSKKDNTILGVRAEGNAPDLSSIVQTIANNYHST